MAKKTKDIEQPIVIEVGKFGKFEVSYRRVQGDEGPAAEFFGLVKGKWVKILRFDHFKNDSHYHYNPDSPQDKKISIDTVLVDSQEQLGEILHHSIPDMVKAAGYHRVSQQLVEVSDNIGPEDDLYHITEKVVAAMNQLQHQEKRKAKQAQQ